MKTNMDMAEIDIDEPRVRVGVIAAPVDSGLGIASGRETASGSATTDPGQELVLKALERVFPVRFERANDTDLSGIDGLLVLGPESLAKTSAAFPQLVLPAGAKGHDTAGQLGGTNAAIAPGELTTVLLADEPGLARPLRGRAISEGFRPSQLPPPASGGAVLASVQGGPVWWRSGDGRATLDVSAYPLAQLRDGEALRDHMRAGCFMRLLPLVQFIGQVLGAGGWKPPPLRASFVVDDPNLHWPSYGFLEYRELVAHAATHGYHLGFATVPIDGWLANRRVTSLLAENASVLSLAMHGNDHIARELGRLHTAEEAQSVIAQALRRIDALERRSGVTVNRVMLPPHGACSEAALRAMFRLGIEAVSVNPLYPWRDDLPTSTPLAGWHPAELVAGGLPVLPRHHLRDPREELALRAMLGQPLILYGHHGDFEQGLDILAQAASEIDALGDVQWGPLGWIARGNYATRRVGETLLVRMHARRIAIEVPTGVSALRVLFQEPLGGAAAHRLAHPGGSVRIAFEHGLGASEPLKVAESSRVELTLLADRPLIPADVPPRPVKPWPWIRRTLVEGRDRLQALR
jgi:hypothetical protein